MRIRFTLLRVEIDTDRPRVDPVPERDVELGALVERAPIGFQPQPDEEARHG